MMTSHGRRRRSRAGAGAGLACVALVVSLAATTVLAGDDARSATAAFRIDAAALAAHELRALDGKTSMTLSQCKGEVVVVSFWASWCDPCRKEIPYLNALDARLRKTGGKVVAVSIDGDRGRAERFAAKHKMAMTLCHDGPDGLVKQLDLEEFPFALVIDAKGRVVYTGLGGGDRELERISSTVDGLLENESIADRTSAGEEG